MTTVGIIMLVVLVLLLLAALYYLTKKVGLTPATSLRTQHIQSLENNMEQIRLFWTQSTATTANTQDVMVSVDSGAAAPVASDLLMSTSEFVAEFPTNAVISWFVRTFNEDKSDYLDSATDDFTANNQEPLTPATGLGHEWLGHTI